MKNSIRIFIILLLIVSVGGCAYSDGPEELFEYEGTVLSKSNTSFLFIERYVEIEQELSLDEAFKEYGRDKVIRFIINGETNEELNVGDKVIVHSNGAFEDMEPITGSAENIEIVEK